MTVEDIKNSGIPIADVTESTVLTVESALEYVAANTNLEFDPTDIESVKTLPSCVKLFVVKFNELLSRESGVTSESIAGMSQSFDTSDNSTLIFGLLNSLCAQYVTSQLVCVPRIRRYVNGC